MNTSTPGRPSRAGVLAPRVAVLALSLACAAVQADDAELDALALEGADAAPAEVAAASRTTVSVEVAAGRAQRRHGLGSASLSRAFLGLRTGGSFAPGWIYRLDDRLDYIDPQEPGRDAWQNSLREAYVGWQSSGGLQVDLGRIDVRNGAGLAFNPTDFFRAGSIRSITRTDPAALRETRMGAFMARVGMPVGTVTMSLAFAPKLSSRPSLRTWSLDEGSTNPEDRWLWTVSGLNAGTVAAQAFLFKESGQDPQLGLNATSVIGQRTVAHLEWAAGEARRLDRPERSAVRHRLATGLTYTTAGKLTLRGEYAYNGFAASRRQWEAMVDAGLPVALGYLAHAQRQQDTASRSSWLLQAVQTDAGLPNLDLTALVRINPHDHSWLAWAEARYRVGGADVALQLQRHGGGRRSQYGVLPQHSSLQLVVGHHF